MMMGEVEKRLEIVRACRDRYNSIVRNPLGDFTSFISTNRGFGNAGLKGGKPFLETVYGEITVKRFVIEYFVDRLMASGDRRYIYNYLPLSVFNLPTTYSLPELLTKETCLLSGDQEGTLIVPCPPYR
jgi:hypothetical protein